MKVRRKLQVLLLSLLLFSSTILTLINYWQNRGVAVFLQNREEEVSHLFDRLLELRGRSLFTLAYDYTVWDEMVQAVETGDIAWIKKQVDSAFSVYNAQAAWVYRRDWTQLAFFTSLSDTEGLPKEIFSKDTGERLFAKAPFVHFFIQTDLGLMEIRGASISPTVDLKHETPAKGYFFVGRLWNTAFLDDLKPLVMGQLKLEKIVPGFSVPDVDTNTHGKLVLHRPLSAPDGTRIAVLEAAIPAPLVHDLLIFSRTFYTVSSVICVFLVLIFCGMLIRWVGTPLRRVAASLDNEDLIPLQELETHDDEFGHIASSIKQFFLQQAALLREISERKKAEEEVRKKDERLRKYFETTSIVGMGILTPDKHWLEVNDKLCSILGYSREELLRLRWDEFTPKEDLEKQLPVYQRVLDGTENVYILEKHYIRKDGTLIDVEVSSNCIRDENGKPAYFMGVVKDITDRKRAEEALQLAQFAVDHAGELIFVVRQDGSMPQVNEAAYRALGYTIPALKGQHVSTIYPAFEAEKFERLWEELRKTHTIMVESDLRHRDGQHIPVEMMLNLLNFKGEEYIFVFARDIVERKKAEQERQRLEEQLRQAQKMESIGRLAGGIAHDFNNLLSPIIGYADLLLNDFSEQDKRYADAKQIQEAAERCATLTRQLLAFSRKQMLDMRVVRINEIIVSFEKMLRRLIGEDVELTTSLAPDAGAIKADSSQIEQILMNLAVNARDAMPNGGKLRISTMNVELDDTHLKSHAILKPGSYVMMSVSDDGVGMDEETREHLFEPFFTTKERGKGTGLGLATVYGIVKQHGGWIWVFSEPNKGSTFKIYLPRVTDSKDPEPKVVVPVEHHSGKESVLVVEDEASVRKLVFDILCSHGYRVVTAATPTEAVEIVSVRGQEDSIQLLLTDVIMPQMNGRQLYEQVHAMVPSIKVLFMSGYTGDTILYHGIEDSGFPFIQKPFSVQSLTRTVRRVLDS